MVSLWSLEACGRVVTAVVHSSVSGCVRSGVYMLGVVVVVVCDTAGVGPGVGPWEEEEEVHTYIPGVGPGVAMDDNWQWLPQAAGQ